MFRSGKDGEVLQLADMGLRILEMTTFNADNRYRHVCIYGNLITLHADSGNHQKLYDILCEVMI